MRTQVRCWWPAPILVAVGLAMAVIIARASTTAPQVVKLQRTRLSTRDWFAAYPDLDVGSNGLVAVVWTEGTDWEVKHNGPLKLAWVKDDSTAWRILTVDDDQSFDAAVAVAGATVHVVWSRPKNAVRYTTCTPPNPDCAVSKLITTATEEALQVDVAVDQIGSYYIVWVEEDNQVHYSFPSGRKGIVAGSANDQEGPAIAYASGFVHVVWTEWLDPGHTDSVVRYRRWDRNRGFWSPPAALANWSDEDYRARNLSIAADMAANVYVVWDMLSIDDKKSGDWEYSNYAIGYAHSYDNGQHWRDTRTYPSGSDRGAHETGAKTFKSTEPEGKEEGVEYSFYLRPYISLAVSGTLPLPILSWHRQSPPEGVVEPGSTQALGGNPYQVLWTYATRPGSDVDGVMFWAAGGLGQPISMTLSTDYFGRENRSVDSATARLAAVGDLGAILDSDSSGTGYLHSVYHEGTETELWRVIYNNTRRGSQRLDYLIPIVYKSAAGGGG